MSESAELKFNASIVQLDAASRTATFYIMNLSKNRNRWAVSKQSLDEAAPTLPGKPIGCGIGHKLGHFSAEESMDVGEFVAQSIPNGYMTAKAKIDDDHVWGLLEAKKWGPISVVISVFSAVCSKCGKDILDEGLEHSHVADNVAYLIVSSFKFLRVDFVADPAYPQAGMLDINAAAEAISVESIQLAAGYYNQGGAPGSSDPDGKRKTQLMSEERIKELEKELQEQADELSAKAKDLDKVQGELDELKAEAPDMKALKERLDRNDARAHTALVIETAKARFDAGLATDLKEEEEAIKDWTAGELGRALADAKVLKAKEKPPAKNPKATHYASGEGFESTDAAFKAAKERLIDPMHKNLVAQLGIEEAPE